MDDAWARQLIIKAMCMGANIALTVGCKALQRFSCLDTLDGSVLSRRHLPVQDAVFQCTPATWLAAGTACGLETDLRQGCVGVQDSDSHLELHANRQPLLGLGQNLLLHDFRWQSLIYPLQVPGAVMSTC